LRLFEAEIVTPEEFWQAYARSLQGTMPQAEEMRFKVAGVIAESQARERGSSLLPCAWQNPEIPASELSTDLLVAIGMTALVLQGLGDRGGNS